MRKISRVLSFVLAVVMVINISGTIDANASSKLVPNQHEDALDIVIETITEVNQLTSEEVELVRNQLASVIKGMDELQVKAIIAEMSTLEDDYKEFKKENALELNKLDLSIKDAVSKASNVILEFAYVGKGLAPLTGLMITMNEAGYEEMTDAIAVAGPAGGFFITWLAGVAGGLASAGVAAVVGTYVLLQHFNIKAQLRRADIAIIFV